MEKKAVCTALILFRLLQPAWCVAHHVDRRSSDGDPDLQMTASYFLNTSQAVVQGSSYEYGVSIRHSPESKADALGVHVTWILTPFLKFTQVTSWPVAAIYQIQQRADSLTFKLKKLPLWNETHFNFSVMFDTEISLRSGWHHIVTHAQLVYYKEYSEDQHGHVQAKGIPISTPLQTVAFAVEIPGCSSPLGMASGTIKDYQLTASSTNSDRQPNQARPGGRRDGWCAALTNDQQFIRLDFSRMTRITRIATYGREQKPHWVTRYMVQYSSEGTVWHNYTENGFTKEFLGNFDKSTPVFHFLANSIEASSIRIRLLAWNNLICMRFEVYGCSIESSPACNFGNFIKIDSGTVRNERFKVSLVLQTSDQYMQSSAPLNVTQPNLIWLTNPSRLGTSPTDRALDDVNCIYPLGLESGYIPDEALSHSVHTTSNPTDIRLNKVPEQFPYGWKAAFRELDYLQVDFGSLRKVSSVATQGSAGDDTYFVKSFQLKYSNNSIDWQEYKENGKIKELRGPKDAREAKYAIMARLLEPIVARYVRFIPTVALTSKVMRAELYGCMVEPMPPYDGVPEYSRRSILLDPVSGWLYVCIYSELSSESSCFSSNDGQDWLNLDEFIIGVLALDPLKKEIFGVDRSMYFHLSTNNGSSWKMVSSEYFYDVKNQNSLVMSKGLPENIVSVEPGSFWSAASLNGQQWAVSSSGVHMMAAGQREWRTVATWKCCGN